MTTAAIPVVIEARHVRLTAAHVELLFGSGHALLALVPLELTERFAAAEVVEVRGPTGSFKNVRVVGPTVEVTGVFVSDADMHVLGFPDARAGLHGDTPPPGATCSVEGPKGTLVLASGGVHPVRRLIVTQEIALGHGLTAGSAVDVVVQGERARELRGIAVEIGAALYLGLDIADANAMDVRPSTLARLSP